MIFDIKDIQEIDWPRAAQDLATRVILRDEDLQLIASLVPKKGVKENIALDDIQGKGLGKVFLLHGT